MEFLNSFLEEETGSMRRFLWRISSPPSGEADDEGCTGWIPQLLSTAPPEKTDLGRHLSCLHTVLFENVTKVRWDGLVWDSFHGGPQEYLGCSKSF